MTIEDIRNFLKDETENFSKADIKEALSVFLEDSDDKALYVSEFLRFGYVIGRFGIEGFLDDIYLINQKYEVLSKKRPELRKKHLPYLYLKEMEYYTVMNSYSECIRVINEIMDLEDVPDFVTGSALSQAIDIFMEVKMPKEADKYVEAMRAFSNICDLPARNLCMIDCNLLQAYAVMGKRKEYEYYRKCITKYPRELLDEGLISLVNLYVLGAEAIIDKDFEPTTEYIREVMELCETGSFETGLTADYSEMLVPILKWIKEKVSIDKLVSYSIKMANFATNIADKIEIYSLLVDEFKVERSRFPLVYEGYFECLKAYYVGDCEIRHHEVVGEMLTYELEKHYRDKAMKDELTGIGNRHSYEMELDEIEAETIDNRLPSDVYIFSLDVNGLKHVNDTFGHQAGDDYIKGAAEALKLSMGNVGSIFRVGGDEFTAIVRGKSLPTEELVGILRKNLSRWSDSYGNELTMSVGIGASEEHPEATLEELIGFADEAMYKDKKRYYEMTGKDRRRR